MEVYHAAQSNRYFFGDFTWTAGKTGIWGDDPAGRGRIRGPRCAQLRPHTCIQKACEPDQHHDGAGHVSQKGIPVNLPEPGKVSKMVTAST